MLNWLPLNISTFGHDVDSVMYTVYWIVGVWFFIAEGLLFYFLWRFRRKDGVRARWVPGWGRAMAWVLVPVTLVLACDLFIEATSAKVWARVKEDIPQGQVLVKITASQFSWRFNYADPGGHDVGDGVQTLGDLYVPLDETVRFDLQSTDVIHSFWVPNLRLKQDVVPGRSIPGWFEATRIGTYPIVCSELCGVGHTMMQGTLHVLSQADYRTWYAKAHAQLVADRN